MIDKRKTTVSLNEYRNNELEYIIDFDVTDMGSDELVDVFVRMMKVQTYHDVAIWRALKAKAEDMVDYFESVEGSKDEWAEEEPPVNQEIDWSITPPSTSYTYSIKE